MRNNSSLFKSGFILIEAIIIVVLLTAIIGIIYFKSEKNNKPERISNKLAIISTEETKVVSLSTTARSTQASDYIKIGDDKNHIYLKFDSKINGNESLENFRKYLIPEQTVIYIPIPEKQVSGEKDVPKISEFDSMVRENLRVNLTSYKEGKLTGKLSTIASKVSYLTYSKSLDCRIDDQLGMCFKDVPVNMKLIVNFEVQVKDFQ